LSERVLQGHHLEASIKSEELLRFPNDLYTRLKESFPRNQVHLIRQAYTFASKAHDGQERMDGKPYINHPLEVARILVEMNMDTDSICAGLMHDVLEDCNIEKINIDKIFGKDVSDIVDGVSKIGKLDFQSKAERNINSFQKMALAMAKDVRVIVVKLADRLHNMRTIDFLPRNKQIRVSKETLEIYGPIALRIGMQNVRAELEDLAFDCLHPLRAEMLRSAIKKSSGGRKKIVYKIKKEIKNHLNSNQVMSTVQGREKNLFSIYRKIKTKHKPFSEVLDVYGFRIIVNSVEDCYKALGLIHNHYKPIEQRFKDYIAIPKSNGYQALHTTLLALDSIPIEIQIQTKSMKLIAENGICAHATYKNEDINDTSFYIRNWMTSLQDLHEKSSSSEDFVESIKTDLFSDEVYIFSPKGQIFNLKTGSTPVDFAYEVHTDIGNSLTGCKINRKYAPLNIQLESGQTVEIETDKKAIVDPAWLNFVVTSKARAAIRAQLKHQKTSAARKAGKLLLESELKRSGKPLKEYRGSILRSILKSTGVRSLNQLLTDIGLGRKTSTIVAERFFDGLQIRKDKKKIAKSFELKNNKIDGLTVAYAKCCMPVQGDSIVAHSDTERGIVIHHSRCNEVAPFKQDKDRYIPSFWSKDHKKQARPCHIKVLSESGPGVLADIASTFTKSDINIISVISKSAGSKLTEFSFDIEIYNSEELKKIMRKVRSMKTVTSCVRDINEAKKK
tara:strand:- start:268 stop:2457 length:2190 start_codon:yes stop_codon:yes gene_type:complete